jgi:hypothetical protein
MWWKPSPNSMAEPDSSKAGDGSRTGLWMAASFAVGLLIVVVFRLTSDPGERVTGALRATARWSFALFWLATVGKALAVLFGPRFDALARRGRELGLCYASAHLAHLGVVAWLYYQALANSVELPPITFFGIAVFWTYLLAALSFKRVSARFNQRTCRILRLIGVEYIALAFLVDFYKDPFQGGFQHVAAYAPFVVLVIAGQLLRLAAAVKSRLHLKVRGLTVS